MRMLKGKVEKKKKKEKLLESNWLKYSFFDEINLFWIISRGYEKKEKRKKKKKRKKKNFF